MRPRAIFLLRKKNENVAKIKMLSVFLFFNATEVESSGIPQQDI